jgi:hypothetical protein
MSRNSAVGIATGYRLDDRMIRVRFPAVAEKSFLRHRVHTGSGVHLASYLMGIGGSFPGVKRLERESNHLTPSSAEVKE